MQTHRPLLTQHCLRRLALWTLTLLQWIAAMLSSNRAITPRHIRQRIEFISLPWLTRRVGHMLIVRAAQLDRRRPRKRPRFWRHGRDLRCAHLIRSLLGGRLRRALKHKDAATWIAKLIHVLRNLDAYARPLMRRLHGGLTRVARLVPAIASAETLCGAPTPAPAFADSS
jgi:hypothetical protein